MKLRESWSFSISNLKEMKLRTALTALGVTIGIGALVAMIGFGSGMQKNVSESFEKLDLLNSVTVLPGGRPAEEGERGPRRPPSPGARERAGRPGPGRRGDGGDRRLSAEWRAFIPTSVSRPWPGGGKAAVPARHGPPGESHGLEIHPALRRQAFPRR